MCGSSFEGFIASFDNLLLQTRQSGQGALESLVEINPYFYVGLIIKAIERSFPFFEVVVPSSTTSDSLDGVDPFLKIFSIDVCFVLIFVRLKI